MTTLALPERWTFGGIDLSSYATITTDVTGADEMPALRGEDTPYTGLSGRRSLRKLLDSRRVTLGLFVLSTSAAGVEGGAVQARANLDVLYSAFAIRTQQTLTRLMPDGTTRSAQAEVVAVRSFVDTLNHTGMVLAVDFWMADPLWYGPSTTGPGAQTFTGSTTTSFNFTATGGMRTRRLLIDFLGPCTSPAFYNDTAGLFVRAQGVTVNAGEHLIIDTQAFTAVKAPTSYVGSIVHSTAGAVEWMYMDPGVNACRVGGASASSPASATITQYPAYL